MPITVSCDEDVEEVGEDEVAELFDRPDNEWYVVRYNAIDCLAILGELWFLTTGLVVGTPMIFAEFPE